MTAPLPDNQEHLEFLCQRLQLGLPRATLTPVPGGFHHRMWRLETSAAVFAVKQLAPDTNLSGGANNPLNQSEQAAALFARCGVPSLHALACQGEFLQVIGAQGYLVYPWTEARGLPWQAIGEAECREVGELLAKMHTADIQVEGLSVGPAPVLTSRELDEGLALATRSNSRDAQWLRENASEFEALVDELESATERLSGGSRVLCHGDLDHKNILWDRQGSPLIIDWESARYLSPTYELLLESLDWSGITSEFRPARFAAMLRTYQDAGGQIDQRLTEPAFTRIQGEWLTWLLYNVGRAADAFHDESHAVGSRQIDVALSAILRLRRLMPRLRDLCHDV